MKEEITPIFYDSKNDKVKIIDQRLLPHKLSIIELKNLADVIFAIKEMQVRGAPLIGVTAAFGMYLVAKYNAKDEIIKKACQLLKDARPTAINLAWAADRLLDAILKENDEKKRKKIALKEAISLFEYETESSKKIGEFGAKLILDIYKKKQKCVNILTHCNAGWLATIKYGTATAPIYEAFNQGVDLHVWVDETRPLNQGSRLTAWELLQHGIKHTIITDNAGGHLMQHDMVDIVIVGTDRTTHTGDVANKIGTYLKALAAKDNDVPFYVALPFSTFDWEIKDGLEIPIEKRDSDEVAFVEGLNDDVVKSVLIAPVDSPCANFAFDVTPRHLITGFITEKGICAANEASIKKMAKN